MLFLKWMLYDDSDMYRFRCACSDICLFAGEICDNAYHSLSILVMEQGLLSVWQTAQGTDDSNKEMYFVVVFLFLRSKITCIEQVCYFLLCILRKAEKYFQLITFFVFLVTQLLSADMADESGTWRN